VLPAISRATKKELTKEAEKIMKFMNRAVFVLLALVPVLAVAVIALATLDRGHSLENPTRVLEHPGPPNLPLIPVFNDVDAVVFCGGRGYTAGSIITDAAFLDRFALPRTYAGKADRYAMDIPNGPRGTRGMDMLPDCSRAFVADTSVNRIRVVDSSVGSKAWGNAKATEGLVGTIPDIDTPHVVAVKDGNVYVTAGTNDPLLLQIGRKAGTPEAYEIKARLNLTDCNTPRSMVLDDSFGFALIGCSISNNVLKVGLNPLRLIASVRTHDPDNGRDGSGPYDIAIRKAGDKTFFYTANKNSDTVSVIEDQGSALALVAAVKVVGKPVDLTNCAAHGQDCAVIFSPEPWSVAVSPNGRFVFTSNNVDRSVGVICAANNTFLGSWRALPVLSTRLADVLATTRIGTDDILYVAEGGTGLYPYAINTLNHLYAACPG
jgi:DNA-binding beta-propeller fold protein YncE